MEIDYTPDIAGPIENNIGKHQYRTTAAPIQHPRRNKRAHQTLSAQIRGKSQSYSGTKIPLTTSIRLVVRGWEACRVEIGVN